MPTLTERVQRGAALLQQKYPNWQEAIDCDRLDMGSSSDGLLEQLYITYPNVLNALGLRSYEDALEYGFDIRPELSDKSNQRQWSALTTAWKTLISQKEK
jgi:hypothetical protein